MPKFEALVAGEPVRAWVKSARNVFAEPVGELEIWEHAMLYGDETADVREFAGLVRRSEQ